jgi:hypothetical protein
MQRAVIAVSTNNNNPSSPPHSQHSSRLQVESSRRGGLDSARISERSFGTTGSQGLQKEHHPTINPNVQNFIEQHADALVEEHNIVAPM